MIDIKFQTESLVRESTRISRAFADQNLQNLGAISRAEYTKSRPSKDEYPVPNGKG
jgi:hypothetical protein